MRSGPDPSCDGLIIGDAFLAGGRSQAAWSEIGEAAWHRAAELCNSWSTLGQNRLALLLLFQEFTHCLGACIGVVDEFMDGSI